jgi:hypothetical protein
MSFRVDALWNCQRRFRVLVRCLEYPNLLLQFLDPLDERNQCVALRIGKTLQWPRLARMRIGPSNSPGRHADGRRKGRYIAEDNSASPDFRAVADRNGAKDFRAHPDHDIVAQRWVTFPSLFAGPTQCHALIKRAIVSNDRSLADYDAHSVIDEQSSSNLCPWMNFDSGQESTDMRQKTGRQEETSSPERRRDSVKDQGMQARIGEEDFNCCPSCRVPVPNRSYLF